jgi:tetratricopeptide (TPR) repeat protein
LADLGVLALEQRQESQSVAYLENALALAQALGDQTRELDILPNLGLATLRIKQPDKAMQYLEKALNMARAAQDRFAEKFALERLGTVYAGIGNLPRSLRLLGESLAIAHDLCDRKHEAELLWHIGIRQAESGQREQAMNYAKAAIHLLESVGNPEANVYREHLQKFEQGAALAGLQGAVESTSNGVIVTTSQTSAGSTTPDRVGPGYLRMATSAAKAFTRFLGSGLKTVTVETMEKRLKQCAACRHHTGMRCRICGCFTNLKARLPHEQCSLGLWAENQN